VTYVTKPPSMQEKEPGLWVIYLPWPHPPTKNQWMRMFWAVRKIHKFNVYSWLVVAKAGCKHWRPLRWPVTVQPVILMGKRSSREPDPGNYQVVINECVIDRLCDEIVRTNKKGEIYKKDGIGMIPDDGPKYVRELSPIVEWGSDVLGVQLIITEQSNGENDETTT
jgi:hypothetical protein